MKEKILLAICSLIYLLGTGLCELALSPGKPLLAAAAAVTAAFWLAMFLLKTRNGVILPLLFFLCALGHIEIGRLTPELAIKQAVFIVMGLAVLVLLVRCTPDYKILEDHKYLILTAGIILQLSVMLGGTEINGAKLWFRIGSLNFQPMEIIKLLFVIFLAAYLKQKKEFLISGMPGDNGRLLLKYLTPLVFIWALCEIMFIVQRDLGVALLLFATFMCIFYCATGRTGVILAGGAMFVAGSVVISRLFTHVRIRFQAWLDPMKYPETSGFQALQGMFALTGGGFFGTGIGLGKPDRIPEVHTDYIFAAIAEEMGFLGAVALLAVYMILISRLFIISAEAKDEFGRLLGCGLTALTACQVMIIICGTVKLIPMTGITLPFVSYGGSSALSNFILIAVMYKIAARKQVS